jgi:serine/threonine protein phosphatase 1
MAIYAIGDIHGCYDALKTLFRIMPRSKDDIYIFLGDYINRGPNSKETIDWLIKFSKTFNSIFLRGNHEILMLVARLNDEKFNEWLNFGGDFTMKSYKIKSNKNWINKITSDHWKFLEDTRPFFQIDKYIFVHAGLELGISLDKQNMYNLFWKKYDNPVKYSDTNIVICGHTSRRNGEIANFGHTVCIDTYACGGKWLTGLNVETKEYYQTNQERKYKKGEITTVANTAFK